MWRGLLYSLNPMVGIIDGFPVVPAGRGEILIFYWPGFLVSTGVVVALDVERGSGIFGGRRRRFADVI